LEAKKHPGIKANKKAIPSQKTPEKAASTNLFKLPEKPLFTPLNNSTETKETDTKPASFADLFKPQDKPLFTPLSNKSQNIETNNKLTDNPFLSKRNLFASGNTSGSSLFGSTSNNKPSFAFEKKASEGAELRNSLFSQVNIKPNILTESTGLGASSLFSANAPPKTFLKVFTSTTSEDPAKKKASLFLNKLESDVFFKVEDQEFPAHKEILSEKCKFFKNMFSSNFL